jgi:16S rRNA (guanine1516-N2)-methyltransferase
MLLYLLRLYLQQHPPENLFARLRVDFLGGALGYRRVRGGGKNQLIARAAGLKTYKQPVTIFDATAGLGKDSFILAALGCTVTLVERSPALGELLQDGLDRAKNDPRVSAIISHMHLIVADAKKILNELLVENYPDIIYLDPMFPVHEKSALNKIEMRLIRELVGDDSDAPLLLDIALKCAKKRVVVKRPRQAKTLNDVKPSLVVAGKANRYDVYLSQKI